MLGWLLHAPRGPFYSPKAARSRWRQSWKANLALCCVEHQTVIVAVRCAIAFQIRRNRPLQLRVSWRTRHCPVHTRQSGAPSRPLVRATRRPRIARPTVALATVGSPDSLVHHRTVRWIIAVRRWSFPESGLFIGDHPGALGIYVTRFMCTTGQSGVPDWVEFWLYRAKSFWLLFFFFSHCF
jgi:hypothetical protein